MSKSVIVENLTKNYIKKEAVKNISFEICENEILRKVKKKRNLY